MASVNIDFTNVRSSATFAVCGINSLTHALDLPYTDPASLVAPLVPAPGGYPVRVDDPDGCDRFSAVAVRGVDPSAPSPAWMTHRLIHAGMRPISLLVDITNYVMLVLGQPMHAFDLDKLRGDLVVRRAVVGETLSTLDGTVRNLDEKDIVIADDSGVISLAAVMGGASTEIGTQTTAVLFEAAHWRRWRSRTPPAVTSWRRGVPRFGAASTRADSSRPPAAVQLLVEYGGGTVQPRDRHRHGRPVRDHDDADHPSRVSGAASGVRRPPVPSTSAARSSRTTLRSRRDVAPRPARADRAGRGRHPARELRRHPERAAAAATQSWALGGRSAGRSAVPRRGRVRRGAVPPSSRPASSTSSGCRPTTSAGWRCASPIRSTTKNH
jgi:hypothetical protein